MENEEQEIDFQVPLEPDIIINDSSVSPKLFSVIV